MTPLDALALAPAAFLAGVLMFLAPCTLPIVPGYLIFIAGVPAEASAANNRSRRRRILLSALAFVIGFSLIFILLGTFAAAIGSLLGGYREILSRAAGAIIVLFGLMMLGAFRLPVLGSEWHAKMPAFLTAGRWESSLLIGMLFAIGWSPCIGPILGTVLLYASTAATAKEGTLLLGVFSAGLGVPFLLTALLIDKAAAQFSKWGRFLSAATTVGGILLIVLGVCILFGAMGSVTAWSYTLFEQLGFNALYSHL